jgi:hypothetical protein
LRLPANPRAGQLIYNTELTTNFFSKENDDGS